MFRWLALVVFAAALSVSAWQRSRAHRDKAAIPRGSESPGLIVGRLVVALPLFGGVVAYLFEYTDYRPRKQEVHH